MATLTRATVRLPRLVGDNMVLQRDTPLPIWGWAAPGERVRISFQGRTYRAPATDATGRWRITLPPLPAGGPYGLTVKGRNTIRLRNILVGDVWLAAGQSNMEWPLQGDVLDFRPEIAAATYPRIRLLTVAKATASSPRAGFKSAGWQECSPQTVGSFSAVAYFFGRRLHRQYQVPIGLISAVWGGTDAESWVSPAALRTLPGYQEKALQLEQQPNRINERLDDYAARRQAWRGSPASRDQGRLPDGRTWADTTFHPPTWATMPVPGAWEVNSPLRSFDGPVWFRREVGLTPEEARQPAGLSLGRIDDQDSTWVNGQLVGQTAGPDRHRHYVVPAGLLQPGRNVITVRVLDTGGEGGFVGGPDSVQLTTATRRLSLAGEWQYQPAYDPAGVPQSPFPNGAQAEPAAIYNAMIAPLLPYALKGIIWYQGENNAPRAYQYRTLFPALIQDWRTRWGQGDLPFLFVQLAGFMPDQAQPADYEWAELREAQLRTLAVPHTGMAVALDLGDPNDIHPRNKQPVGERLALAARRVAYQDSGVVHSGPLLQDMRVQGNTVRLRFSQTGGGLVLKDATGPYLRGFALAGADRKFVWAQGRLEGQELVLYSDQVATPVAVRYAWGNSPFPNLYNTEDLPASPFRTDDWPGLTVNR
ncbi:sialate O-acetylesterase [Hymenobacter fastidiosus]|uniref:Sialate O-acetylesterase n=2 Tax=Hymenobacter fastidiosus TaxID=486264 RepID=A0ABP7RIV6_9BACT